MENMESLLNLKRSMFYDTDEHGRISFRGKYLNEFKEDEYAARIKAIRVSGFKAKNLRKLSEAFPAIERLTIEKTSKLISLEGIELWSDLNELRIEDCPKLTDLSALKSLLKLKLIGLEKFTNAVNVIQFLSSSELREVYLNDNLLDFDLISEMNDLEVISLEGYKSERVELPLLPPISKSFGISGFNKLQSAGFLANQPREIHIRWWGPEKVTGVPKHLENHDALKKLIL